MALLFLAIPLGVLTGFVLLMVKASEQGQPAAIVLFAIPALAGLALAALFARIMRPLTLTQYALRIPPSGFRTVVIPLNDIAGVGLLYRVHRPPDRSPSAWYVYVWRRNSSVQRVNGPACRKRPDAPSSQIGASRAGRTVRRLDNKIRAIQGPAGSLATLELQKHAKIGLTDNSVAFWSPDGEMGPSAGDRRVRTYSSAATGMVPRAVSGAATRVAGRRIGPHRCQPPSRIRNRESPRPAWQLEFGDMDATPRHAALA